jgi:hypothetical protein
MQQRSSIAGSFPIVRGTKYTTATSTPNQSTQESTDRVAQKDNAESKDGASSFRILWENTRRRDKCTSSNASNLPAVKIATRQLRGAIVSGYHGIGFCPWPEEDPQKLNKVLGKVWREMADNQRATADDMSSAIDTSPTPFEARRV